MLRKRLIASFLMIAPVLAIFWLDTNCNFDIPGIWIAPVCMLASVIIASELLAMLGDRTPGATPWVVYLGTILCHLAIIVPGAIALPHWFPDNRAGLSGLIIFITIAAAFLHELRAFSGDRQSALRIALTVFAVLYAGWLLSFLVATRVLLGNELGAFALFSILFIIKMSDAGAYFVGKQLGKHKLAPLLSPGKTWEGLVGGILAAVLAGFFGFWVLKPILLEVPPTPWWAVLGYAVSIAAVGVVGDLCESLLKRDMGCKDSSRWLPGLGGMMDTADSLLLSAPVAFLWWMTRVL